MHPHPGLVINVYEGETRARILASRGAEDWPRAQLCLLLMISHSAPARGEHAELIPSIHRTGTQLDLIKDLFVCYRHFDVAFVPGQERTIGSVQGPYLGRMSNAATQHYRNQFTEIQAFKKRRSYKLPSGLFRC